MGLNPTACCHSCHNSRTLLSLALLGLLSLLILVYARKIAFKICNNISFKNSLYQNYVCVYVLHEHFHILFL